MTLGAIETQKTRIPCEIWMRVVGYYRPKNLCNLGKQAEISERKLLKNLKNISNAKGGV